MSLLEAVAQRVAVENETVAFVRLGIEVYLCIFLWSENGFVACREVLELHAGSEDGVAAVAELDGTGVGGCGCNIAGHGGVVPV